jgi:serine/threonine protein kinase
MRLNVYDQILFRSIFKLIPDTSLCNNYNNVGCKLFIVMEYVGGGSVKDIVPLYIYVLTLLFLVGEERRHPSVGSVHSDYHERVTLGNSIFA